MRGERQGAVKGQENCACERGAGRRWHPQIASFSGNTGFARNFAKANCPKVNV